MREARASDARTVEEATAGAMAILLAILDTARSMEPPEGTTPRQTLDQFAAIIEKTTVPYFGDEPWGNFVREARRFDAAKARNN